MNSSLDEFAQAVVRHVRDAAIREADSTLRRSDPIAQRWNKVIAEGSQEVLVSTIISDVVDMTIAKFLGAIDDGSIHMSFTSSSGEMLDLTSIVASWGAMSGAYGGDEGWKERYSSERFFQDFRDLRDFFENDKGPQ